MKNKIRNEKGSITLYVIITMLFFSVFIMSIYIMNSRKYESQLEANTKVKEIYAKKSAEDVFNTHFAGEDEKIPIYTADQLLSIGSGKSVYIPQTNKIYIFTEENDKYVIKNNITGLTNEDISEINTSKYNYIENYGVYNEYYVRESSDGIYILKN